MVTISVAVTAPVNPPSTDDSSTTQPSILTHDELWAAMVHKSRYPTEFIPQIVKSRIVREDEKGITRAIVFNKDKEDQGEEEELLEDITYSEKMKISFHIPKTGQLVDNIISFFPSANATTATPTPSTSPSPSLLHLTFTFEWQHPEVAAGSEAAKQLEQQYYTRASYWVPHSLAVARKLKEEGRLQLG